MARLAERLEASGVTAYAVCFSVRSGSTLLCEDLRANGIGDPSEHFQSPLGHGDFATAETFVEHLVQTRAVGGHFGFKVSWEQAATLLAALVREGAALPGDDLHDVFPGLRYVHLTREDKVHQTISYWRALRTGIWHRPTGGDVDTPGRPALDLRDASECFLQLCAEDVLWQRFFRDSGADALQLTYEAYVADRPGHLARLADHLGVGGGAPLALSDSLEVMADDWSRVAERELWDHLRRPSVARWTAPVFEARDRSGSSSGTCV